MHRFRPTPISTHCYHILWCWCLEMPGPFLLFLFLTAVHVNAWSNVGLSAIYCPSKSSTHQQVLARTHSRIYMSSPRESATRGEWLHNTAAAMAAVGVSSSLLATPGRSTAAVVPADTTSVWAPEGDPKAAASWFPLLRKCFAALEDILQNWDKLTVRQDGDAIRRLIGTIGVSSPLSSLRRAFVSVRDAEEESQGDIEVIEFVEAYMEVLTALGDAENDLYSANFAEYAGGGGMKASQFISKAKKSLIIARDQFKEVNRILNI